MKRQSPPKPFTTSQQVLTSMCAVLLLTGCGGPPPKSSAERQTQTKPIGPLGTRASSTDREVYTTFYPTQYFAERIGSSHIEVVCPVPKDADPISWLPELKTIQAYQSAALIIINGAEFEKWISKVSLPHSRMVNTAKSFRDRFIEFEDTVTHSHGKEGEHAHEGIDGHTWLDPHLAKIQAREILKALVKIFPEHAADFEKGYASLSADLDSLDAELKELQQRLKREPLLASHQAYNYIARRYDWNLKNLDLNPEQVPTDEQMKGIAKFQKDHPAKYVLWESAPLTESAERMKKELGLESIEFSPCELMSEADRNAGKDYLSVMKQNLKNLLTIQNQ